LHTTRLSLIRFKQLQRRPASPEESNDDSSSSSDHSDSESSDAGRDDDDAPRGPRRDRKKKAAKGKNKKNAQKKNAKRLQRAIDLLGDPIVHFNAIVHADVSQIVNTARKWLRWDNNCATIVHVACGGLQKVYERLLNLAEEQSVKTKYLEVDPPLDRHSLSLNLAVQRVENFVSHQAVSIRQRFTPDMTGPVAYLAAVLGAFTPDIPVFEEEEEDDGRCRGKKGPGRGRAPRPKAKKKGQNAEQAELPAPVPHQKPVRMIWELPRSRAMAQKFLQQANDMLLRSSKCPIAHPWHHAWVREFAVKEGEMYTHMVNFANGSGDEIHPALLVRLRQLFEGMHLSTELAESVHGVAKLQSFPSMRLARLSSRVCLILNQMPEQDYYLEWRKRWEKQGHSMRVQTQRMREMFHRVEIRYHLMNAEEAKTEFGALGSVPSKGTLAHPQNAYFCAVRYMLMPHEHFVCGGVRFRIVRRGEDGQPFVWVQTVRTEGDKLVSDKRVRRLYFEALLEFPGAPPASSVVYDADDNGGQDVLTLDRPVGGQEARLQRVTIRRDLKHVTGCGGAQVVQSVLKWRAKERRKWFAAKPRPADVKFHYLELQWMLITVYRKKAGVNAKVAMNLHKRINDCPQSAEEDDAEGEAPEDDLWTIYLDPEPSEAGDSDVRVDALDEAEDVPPPPAEVNDEAEDEPPIGRGRKGRRLQSLKRARLNRKGLQSVRPELPRLSRFQRRKIRQNRFKRSLSRSGSLIPHCRFLRREQWLQQV